MTELPLTIDLTSNGKTLVALYPCANQGKIMEAFLNLLGEQEEFYESEDNPGVLCLLFPHQNMPEDVKEIAERMTTANLLKYLGFEPEGGFVI